MKKILVGFFLFFLFIHLAQASPMGSSTSDLNTPDIELKNGPEKERVIVLFKEIPKPEVIKKHNGEIKIKFKIIPGIAAEIPKQAIPALKKEPSVKLVEPDYILKATPMDVKPKTPRSYEAANENAKIDPPIAPRWNLKEDGINAEAAWNNYSVNGTGIKIAIIDTGVKYTLDDLDNNYLGGYDFVNGDNDPRDDNDHGTYVASVSVAEGYDKIVGAAYDSGYYAVKVLNRFGEGYTSWVIQGVEWATDNNADIISMSLGGYGYSSAFEEAVNNSYANGTILVAASGNDGYSYSAYPAAFANVISVGAHAEDQTIPTWSNGEVDLVAPGVSVVAMARTGKLWYVSGTSIATPHVSATVALQKHYAEMQSKIYNNSYYWQTIKQSAIDLGYTEERQGEGKVNADKAIDIEANDWYLSYEVIYLDYLFINEDGLPAYSVDSNLSYQINITNNQDKAIENLKVIATQAYYGHQNNTALPGDSTEEFLINISSGTTTTLDDYYYIPNGTYPGNDSTVIILEINSYIPKATILTNTTAGVWCPL